MFVESQEIPLEGLFQEIEYPTEKPPFRWLTLKSAMEVLGLSESSVQRYAKGGKLERMYKTVKGHRKVYYSNHSVYALRNLLNSKRERKLYEEYNTDTEEDDEY